MNVRSREGGPSPEELFFGKPLEKGSSAVKPRETLESRQAANRSAAMDRARLRLDTMREEAKGAAVLDPEFVKSSIEREIEETENEMAKLKRGSDEWNELAGKDNELDLELSVLDDVWKEGQEFAAKEEEEAFEDEEVSTETTAGTLPAITMPESEMLTKQKVFEARQNAFARAKAKAEEIRASYAKPAPSKPASTGFFSRVTGWFASLGKQREAGKKIAEALTPALREQRAPEIQAREARAQAREEEAKRNAAAYEARAMSRSRAPKLEEAQPPEEAQEAAAAK